VRCLRSDRRVASVMRQQRGSEDGSLVVSLTNGAGDPSHFGPLLAAAQAPPRTLVRTCRSSRASGPRGDSERLARPLDECSQKWVVGQFGVQTDPLPDDRGGAEIFSRARCRHARAMVRPPNAARDGLVRGQNHRPAAVNCSFRGRENSDRCANQKPRFGPIRRSTTRTGRRLNVYYANEIDRASGL
jgi:hypothetical protein